MGLSVNTNIAALNAYRNLSNTQNDQSKSLEKLSSGFRINRAADDAAGLAISEGMRSQIGGIKMGVRNAQDGISVVQTAEGALNETHSILQRMRDLSVQAANTGGLNDDAKQNIQAEIGQLKDEVNRIAKSTTFNGQKLLDGSYNGTFQVGANAGDTISVGVSTKMDTTGLGISGIDVTAVASNAITADTVNAIAGTAGTVTTNSGVDYTAAASWTSDNLNGSVSVGGKTFDIGAWASDGSGTKDLASLNTAMASALGSGAVTATVDATSKELVLTGAAPASGATAAEVASASVVFSQATGASEGITKLDDAIKSVSTTRANLGAVQNRFDHTINSLNVAVENLTASESRIRDTDMASEMVNYTKNQILSQAGTAMLAQAKSLPQSVLSLLQ